MIRSGECRQKGMQFDIIEEEMTMPTKLKIAAIAAALAAGTSGAAMAQSCPAGYTRVRGG